MTKKTVPYPVVLETERLVLRQGTPEEAERVLAYYEANEAHLARWVDFPIEDMRQPDRLQAMFEQMARTWRAQAEGAALRMLVIAKDGPPDAAVGTVFLTRFRFDLDRSCTLSFSVASDQAGKGYVTEAARRAIAFAFDELGMHRVDAEHRTDNPASAAVLARLGFHVIGVAPRYRYSAGQWRDHVLNTLINPAPITPEVKALSE